MQIGITNKTLAGLLACTGVACAAGFASAQVAKDPTVLTPFTSQRADNPADNRGTASVPDRGLVACPVNFNSVECSAIDIAQGANFSFAGGFHVADNFLIDTGGTVDQICWMGRYVNDVLPTTETWRIRIYGATTDGNNLPDTGNIVHEILTGTADGNYSVALHDPLGQGLPNEDEFMHSVEGLSLAVNPGECYWLEVVNTSDLTTSGNWGWVSAGGVFDLISVQAQLGAYNIFSQVPNDRAFCIGGTSLSPDVGFTCTVPPPPDICQLNPADGQQYDDVTGFGFNTAAPGSMVTAVTVFERGESFTFPEAGNITEVCFWSFWFAGTGNTQVAGVPNPSRLRVAYYENNGNFPADNPFAEFSATDAGVTVIGDGEEYHVTHPPVAIEADTCYWLSVSNLSSGTDDPTGQGARLIWFLTNDGAPGAPAPAPFDRTIGARQILADGSTGAWGSFDLGPPNDSISNLSFLFEFSGSSGVTTPDCEVICTEFPVNDECPLATAITGLGVFDYDSTCANTDGSTADCAGTAIGVDVWYVWTAPCDGTFSLNSCGLAAGDQSIAVYAGNTADCYLSLPIVCDDDGCGDVGGSSTVTFAATQGDEFIFRIGDFAAVGTGLMGQFQVERTGGDCPGGDGACCLFVAGCPSDCFIASEGDCTAAGGTFQGAGSDCSSCTEFNPCDWNGDGSINTADFFEFFAAFFGTPPDADYNGDGDTNTADFFGFFGCFFATPPGSQTFCP